MPVRILSGNSISWAGILVMTYLKHWRVPYYGAWIFPVLIAAFYNYTISVKVNPEASWLWYMTIHFFYWMTWGVLGELIYRASPRRLYFNVPSLWRFIAVQLLILLGVLVWFSVYFYSINTGQFSAAASLTELLQQMYLRRGPLLFHTMNIVMFLFVLSACLVVRQSRYMREQEEKQTQLELQSQKLRTSLTESKLTALNNQIHPHFLFNVMNNIASLIEIGDNEQAYKATTLLAGLLRKTFEYIRLQAIRLDDEIELVSLLLEIGALRFGDRMTWSVDIDDSLAQVLIPPFLIQPLVENAIRHAVEESTTPIHISIQIENRGDTLGVVVSDNGPGMSASSADESDGVGLRNLRERLALMTGNHRSLNTSNNPDGGLRVDIALPLKRKAGFVPVLNYRWV